MLPKKRLALSIIDFLNRSVSDGTIPPDEAESIEIATTCIAEAFKVDPHDEGAVKEATGGKSLIDIFSGKASGSSPAGPPLAGASAKDKEAAEALKGQGNAAMKTKDYKTAIEHYTKALDLVPLNPVYLSNRAAAYSHDGRHDDAAADAEMAVAADPGFSKAWSRLGYAKFALGDSRGAMEAYKKGIDSEGSGGTEPMRKGYEMAKRKVEEEGGDVDAVGEADRGSPFGGMPGMGGMGGMPDLSSLAGMFGGGAGGGAPGGGMPDMSDMMNNPMMRQMAQSIMSDPGKMASLMNNPHLKSMLSGGGMPDVSTLMQDPSLRDMYVSLTSFWPC
jgi:small glutamine-rich tetratricopeptide repeat-containing protein alpha